MDRTALVTGSAIRVAEVGDALEKAGFTVTRATDRDALTEACATIAAGSLDCYVQLPRETVVHGESLIERVRQFLVEGLITRFEWAAAVAPLLAAEGYVVLVAGNVPGSATPDDRHARIDLLRVLARAILADCGGSDVRAVVVGYDRSATDIADIAWKRGEGRGRAADVAALPSDLNYADWQKEYLTLTTKEE